MSGRYRRPVTVLIRWVHKTTGLIKLIPRILPETVFTSERESTAIRTGVILNQANLYMIFDTPQLTFIPYHEWLAKPEDELDGFWSLQVGGSTNTVIIPQAVQLEIPAGTNAEITNIERDIITQNVPSGRRFDWIDGSTRIAGYENHQFDVSPKASHILIRA